MKYPTLPVMQCDPNCGDCCGPVLLRQIEFEAIKSYVEANSIVPLPQGLTCPLYQHGVCTVYEVRPMVCRLFGHDEQLNCSRGYNVNIGSSQRRKINEPYERALKSEGARSLHELLDNGLEYLKNAHAEQLET